MGFAGLRPGPPRKKTEDANLTVYVLCFYYSEESLLVVLVLRLAAEYKTSDNKHNCNNSNDHRSFHISCITDRRKCCKKSGSQTHNIISHFYFPRFRYLKKHIFTVCREEYHRKQICRIKCMIVCIHYIIISQANKHWNSISAFLP